MLYRRIIFFAICICIGVQVNAQLKRFSFTQPKMGSPFTILLYAADSIEAARHARDCFLLVDSFNLLYSDYIDSSELSLLTSAGASTAPIPVSPAMLDILWRSSIAYEQSGGAFDITVGPLVKLWRAARKAKQFPAADKIEAARRFVGFNNLVIDTARKTVLVKIPGMKLDLGGIAQGYIGQKVLDLLRSRQVEHALVNVSGDIITGDAPPGSAGWTIGVNVPGSTDELLSREILIQRKAVITSGDAFQFLEHDGKRYSHIVDPRTGYGVTFQRNVTIIAEDGTTADWLATACSIIPLRKAKKLAKSFGAELLITEMKKGKLVLHETKGFKQYWKPVTHSTL